jgi:hypothetical protein
MPQQTNLNVSPYFDDFDNTKDFHKVLFKPGFPVQARELTTLQSILQEQVEKFGSHFFKEGSMVIPGGIGCDFEYYGVKIDSAFFGVPVTSYLEKLVDVEITGATSGVVAKVVKVLDATRSEQSTDTLYVKYLASNPITGQQVFSNGEPLITSANIIYGSTLIKAGTTFANTVANDAAFKASAVTINDGVYYTRGYFVNVKKQTVVVDQYNNKPSARVGLIVDESIVTSLDDNSLNDNSQGFSNYAAPGADRLKISLVLFKKSLDDFNDQDFIELVRLKNGVIEKFVDRSQYSIIRDELARRTYDESGDYSIKPFEVFPKETLNNLMGNNGLFISGSTTPSGNLASDDLLTYQIMPGKAYVRGYDIETLGPEFVDVKKPRTTVGIPTNAVYIDNGTVIRVNNIFGWPKVGYESTSTVDLRNVRRDLTSGYNQVGVTTVGSARIYDFISDEAYENETSQFNLYVYDVQTYSTVGVNTLGSSGLSVPAFVKGSSSGATGHLKYNVNAGDTVLTLTNTTGSFIQNENLIINGVKENYLVTSTYDYKISDVKSVFQNASTTVGIETSFNADCILNNLVNLTVTGSDFSITGQESGDSTVGVITASNASFNNLVRVDDIVAYAKPGSSTLTFNKVTSVDSAAKELSISGITTVSGVCDGAVVTNDTINTSNLFVIRPSLVSKNFGSFFNPLRYPNVSSVDLSLGDIEITYQFTGIDASTGQFSIDLDSIPDFQDQPNVFWKGFSVNNYRLINSNGTSIPLKSGNIQIIGRILYVTNINLISPGSGTTNSILTCILNKNSIKSKTKSFTPIDDLVISRSKYVQSGIGITTLDNGLEYSRVYGTRVEDDIISLNTCDVFRVYGIYESSSIDDPSLPTLTLTEITSTSTTNLEFVVGEIITSFTSKAKAIVVKKIDSDKLEIQYLNSSTFSASEQFVSLTTGITARCFEVTLGDKNVISDFYFDNGIRDEYYDYSRIIRAKKTTDPKRKLRVIFQKYSVPGGDTGDFFTVNSYPADNYQSISMIPYRNGYIRNSDGIDIRPRVKNYSLTSSRSPFEFDGKDFSETSDNSEFVLTPNTSVEIAYNFYVGRIDKIYLNRDGKFFVTEGIPSIDPKPPTNEDSSLEIGTAYLPPYVYSAKSVKFVRTDSKRYTMKDISKLENRISNVEFYTSLSLLENDTNALVIKDPSTGLDRFKSGFFVDNFKSLSLVNTVDPTWGCSIDTVAGEARPMHHTPAIDLQLGSSAIPGVSAATDENQDLAFVTDLGNPNIRKTGDLLTLDYSEAEFQSQLFATRTENVNPFNIVNWSGSVEMQPASDMWIETSRPTINNVSFEGSYQAFMDLYPPEADGWSAIQWNAWEENFAGRTEDARPLGGSIVLNETVTPTSNWSIGEIDRSRVHISSNGAAAALEAGDSAAAAAIISGLTGITGSVAGSSESLFTGTGGAFFGTTESGAGEVEVTRTVNRTTTSGQATEITVNRPFTRSGVSFRVSESVDTQSLGSKLVSREVIPNLRLRNIEFTARRMKPSTALYAFFDGINVNNYIIPKLIEIEMVSGVFQTGERVVGFMPGDSVSSRGDGVSPRILFRLADSNHKYGPYNAPTETYTTNPYDISSQIESSYSPSSTILNVDTYSLSDITSTGLGWIGLGQNLVGQTSGAQARITNIRLVTDPSGSVTGCLFIPDPNIESNPKFETGTKTFRLTDSPSNSLIGGLTNSSAEASWFASGQLDNLQEDIVSIRNARVERQDHDDRKVETERRQEFRISENTVSEEEVRWVDPLCQSFVTGNGSGIFVTSIEVFFRTKSSSIPITCQIRSLVAGNPTQRIPAFGEVSLDPSEVNLSEDGTVSTKFTFPSPVYLPANQEYGITLLSNSDEYNVFIARMGEIDVTTVNNDESGQIIVSQQPSAGVLFKSQNGSTWTANQYEDLKYIINKAKFVTQTGTARFYSPILSESNNLIRRLRDNPLEMNSRQLRIGLSTDISNSTLSSIPIGIGITQESGFYGRLVGLGGTIKENNQGIIVNDVGIGITPLSGSYVYENVYVTSDTGNGASCQIFVQDGSIVSAGVTVVSGGNGYQLGQRLSIASTSFAQIGNETPILSVGLLEDGRNVLFVDNVQGTFVDGNTIQYVDGSGIGVTFINQTPNSQSIYPDNTRDGLHMNVKYYGHGMHSNNNIVEIKNIKSDSTPVLTLTQSMNNVSTDLILTSVGNTSVMENYQTYENISVGSTTPGYVQIGSEIIKYTGLNDSSTGLSGVVRGQFGTIPTLHEVNSKVFKYELNGISLARLNTTFNFNDVSVSQENARDLDNFYVKINPNGQTSGSTTILADRSESSGLPTLYFKESKSDGGTNIKASKNIQFESIHPNVQVFTPADTFVTSSVRTINATSIGAVQNENAVSETSFLDNGFEDVTLNENNPFNTPRMIASRVNELEYLDNLPGNRSLTLEVNLNTTQEDISPVIDLNRVNAILTTNRINNPVDDFVANGDIMSPFNDPHSAIYVTKPIAIENPASSLKVIFSANKPPGTDIRALYKIYRSDGPSNPDYELFPGYSNLNANSEIIDPNKNDGSSDRFIPNSNFDNQFNDHEFTITNLPEFRAYAIKLIFTSTNQAYVPRIRDFRVIALA